MQLIVDFILLAASGVATIYCFVLSRRLSRLNDMKNGIGASIATMSQALDQTQQVLAFAKSSSLEGVQRLTAVLEEAERVGPEINKLLDALRDLSAIAADDIEKARAAALEEFWDEIEAAGEGDVAYLDDPPMRKPGLKSKRAA